MNKKEKFIMFYTEPHTAKANRITGIQRFYNKKKETNTFGILVHAVIYEDWSS